MKRGWFTNNRTGWRVDRAKEPEKAGKDWPDFGGFDNMAACFRGLDWWWLWPLLVVLDLELIFAAVQYRWFNKKTEPLNFLVRLAIARYWLPTPTALVAMCLTSAGDMAARVERYMIRGPHTAPPLHTIWNYKMLRGFCAK